MPLRWCSAATLTECMHNVCPSGSCRDILSCVKVSAVVKVPQVYPTRVSAWCSALLMLPDATATMKRSEAALKKGKKSMWHIQRQKQQWLLQGCNRQPTTSSLAAQRQRQPQLQCQNTLTCSEVQGCGRGCFVCRVSCCLRKDNSASESYHHRGISLLPYGRGRYIGVQRNESGMGALQRNEGGMGALKPATPVAYGGDMVLRSAGRYAHLQLLNAAQVGCFDRSKED